MRPLAILLFFACSAHEHTAQYALGSLPDACVAPPGAIPNDGQSDRAAIQAALDAIGPSGGTVCLGPGRWTIDRAPDGSYNNHAGISTHGRNVSIVGVGPQTVLEVVGDQAGQAIVVVSIDPSAEHIRVADLAIDTTGMVNTHEQTHAIGTSGMCSGETCKPIRDVKFENLTCHHPRNTPSRKGDCFRLLGSAPETEVYGARIVGNDVRDAARSAIELQRGLHGVVIANNTLHCETCDQTIDGEATGGWDYDIVISGNTLSSGSATQGGFAISCTSCVGVVIDHNVSDRGIVLYRTRRVAVTGNSIEMVARDQRALLEAHNMCDGLVLGNNTLWRGGVAGPVIELAAHTGVACSGATIASNAIVQETPAPAIKLEGSSRVSMTGNAITYTVPAPRHGAIHAWSVMAGGQMTGLQIGNNVISGPVSYAVRLSASPGAIGAISITGNIATGPDEGLHCEDAYFVAPISSGGNAWQPGSWPPGTVIAGSP